MLCPQCGYAQVDKPKLAWMIERSSTLWGVEWYCSGEKRWTKDANKAIHFPDRESAEETWFDRQGDNAPKTFPYTQEGAGDWEYTYNVTEHKWI